MSLSSTEECSRDDRRWTRRPDLGLGRWDGERGLPRLPAPWPHLASRQLPGLIDALIVEHHDALLDRLELRINEVAKEIGS